LWTVRASDIKTPGRAPCLWKKNDNLFKKTNLDGTIYHSPRSPKLKNPPYIPWWNMVIFLLMDVCNRLGALNSLWKVHKFLLDSP
jgi:hypothetical protein